MSQLLSTPPSGALQSPSSPNPPTSHDSTDQPLALPGQIPALPRQPHHPTPVEKRKASQPPMQEDRSKIKRKLSHAVEIGKVPYLMGERGISHQSLPPPYTYLRPGPYVPYTALAPSVPRPPEPSWTFSPKCGCSQCKAFQEGAMAYNQVILAQYPHLRPLQPAQPPSQPFHAPIQVPEVLSAYEAMRSLQDVFWKLKGLRENAPTKIDDVLIEMEGKVRELGRWVEKLGMGGERGVSGVEKNTVVAPANG